MWNCHFRRRLLNTKKDFKKNPTTYFVMTLYPHSNSPPSSQLVTFHIPHQLTTEMRMLLVSGAHADVRIC